mgnify:FL=1
MKKVVPAEPFYIWHMGHAKGPEAFKAKQIFYQNELAKFKAADGRSASQAFDTNFKEFMDGTEKNEDVLEYTGPYPTALQNHPIMKYEDEKFKGKNFKNWKDGTIYGETNVPLIAIWMWGKFQKHPAIYNTIECS